MTRSAASSTATLLATVVHHSLPHRLADFVARPLTIVLVIALVGCSLTLASLRRQAVRRRLEGQRSDP